jgi:hypothetical protein
MPTRKSGTTNRKNSGRSSVGRTSSTNKKTNTVGRKSGLTGSRIGTEGSYVGSSGSKPGTGKNRTGSKGSVTKKVSSRTSRTTGSKRTTASRGGTKPLNDVSGPNKKRTRSVYTGSRTSGFSTRGAKSQTVMTDTTKGNMFSDERDTDISSVEDKVI